MENKKHKIVIHKDNIEIRIFEEELEEYLANSWIRGITDEHRKHNTESHYGQSAWNKGLTKETSEGIRRSAEKRIGRSTGPSWNKGLTAKTDERVAKSTAHATETKIARYGNGYGKDNNMTEEHKQHISESTKGVSKQISPEVLKRKLEKDYATKKKNNTFNTSKPEEKLYEEFKTTYAGKTIIRQYKDERYPFYCDFYIVEDDLFIELNAHWSHGGHPFSPDDPADLEKLELWKEKAKTSQFYAASIITWTDRDVKKQAIAKQNNLNYIVIY